MAFAHFLAMTSAEFDAASALPSAVAWMACHFSPYSTGLSNLPRRLPEGSLLILNDRTPMAGQDPERILAELGKTIEKLRCCGLLLDLQRPKTEETESLVRCLSEGLSCPVAAPPEYDRDGPVFLPPVPLDVLPETYFSPWKGREIWLESALSTLCITLTSSGADRSETFPEGSTPFADTNLFCHYRIETGKDLARFVLTRTAEDLDSLLKTVPQFGVSKAVGLYQELWQSVP